MENHQLNEASHDGMTSSDSHQRYPHHGRYPQQNASLGSATIPPFASLLTNNFSTNEAQVISSATGLSFASGIAGTGLRGLFDPFNRLNYERNPQQELELLRQQQRSIADTLAGNNIFRTMSRSPLSSSSIDMGKRWTLMTLALEHLQQELNAIPTNEKLDYLAALQVAPDLVLKESDPTRFLRNTNYDAPAAARKLVFYWKSRRSIFGDRAYRPMTLTGDGAPSAEVIAFIQSGYITYAPKDQEGCTVVIYDGSRRNCDLYDVRKRAIFYHAQVISENPQSQTCGLVMLCVINAPKYDQLTAEAIYMATTVFPTKLKSWHCLDCMSEQDPLRQGYLLGFMEQFLHRFDKSCIYFHSPTSKRDTLWELVTEHGLSIESIPECVGGSWTYERFDEWWVQRVAVERRLFFFHHSTGEPMAYNERRQIDPSPRLHKRSKCSGDNEKSKVDQDSTSHASSSSTSSSNKNSKGNSMDDLLEEFQHLLFIGSSSASTETTGKACDDNVDEQHEGHIFECLEPEVPIQNLDSAMVKLEALQKALDAIPVLEKVDFLTALHLAPHLVLRESDPSRFLAFHEFDPEQAARGIVSYWKQRHDIFGDRAFLPMTMTGDGAMNADDIAFLKTGSIVITGKDRHGGSVMVFDAARRTTEDAGLRMRTAFYMWQILCEYHVNQKSEFVVIQIITAKSHYDKAVTQAVQMVLKVFPIKSKALHTFDLTSNDTFDLTRDDLFRRGFVQATIGFVYNLYSTAKTFSHSREHNNLQTNHGLSKEVLPGNIGGTWSYERFDEWQVQRIQLEREMYFTPKTTDSRIPEISSLASEQVTSAEAAVHNSDAMICEQNVTSSNDAVNLTSPACTVDQVQTNESSAVQDDNYLSMLDSEIRGFPVDLTTTAYWKAREKAPREIWNNECNPEWFLRVEDFDVKKAAERLVRYWHARSQIFGSSRHDRLTQTGDEALGRQELPVLNTGFLTLLPMDSEGRSVLCIDPDRLDYTTSKDARDRCIFYMMSLLTENDISQTDGVVLIHKVSPPTFSVISAPLFERLTKVLPLRLHAIHVICREDVPMDVVKSLEPLNAEVHVHASSSKDALLSALESFGMTKPNLPKFVNGEWGYETFVQWQEYRTRMEWRIPLGWSGRKCENKSSFPGIRFSTQLEADVVERKRRMDLIHFRRKQNRDRVAIAILKENYADLQDEQKTLRHENQQLEAKHAAVSSILLGLPRD